MRAARHVSRGRRLHGARVRDDELSAVAGDLSIGDALAEKTIAVLRSAMLAARERDEAALAP